MTTTIDPATIEGNVRQLVAETLARDPASVDPAARSISPRVIWMS